MEQMTATKDGEMVDKVDAWKNQTKVDDCVEPETQGEWKEVTSRRSSPRNTLKLVIDTSSSERDDTQSTKGSKRRKETTPRSSGEVVNKRINTSVVVKQEMMDEEFPPLVQASNKVITIDMTQDSNVGADNLDSFVDAVPFSGDDASETGTTVLSTQEETIEFLEIDDNTDDDSSDDSDHDADGPGSRSKEIDDEQKQKHKETANKSTDKVNDEAKSKRNRWTTESKESKAEKAMATSKVAKQKTLLEQKQKKRNAKTATANSTVITPIKKTMTTSEVAQDKNTILPIRSTPANHTWTMQDRECLYRCYCLAVAHGESIGKGTYARWRAIHPDTRMNINVASLSTQRQWTEKHALTKEVITKMKKEAEQDAMIRKTTQSSSIIEKLRSKKSISTKDVTVIEEGVKASSFAAARQRIDSCISAATTPHVQTSTRNKPSSKASTTSHNVDNTGGRGRGGRTGGNSGRGGRGGRGASIIDITASTHKETCDRKLEKKKVSWPTHRVYMNRFDIRLMVGKGISNKNAKDTILKQFILLFKKIFEEERSIVLYPYSSSSNAVPITEKSLLPNTYGELMRYVPSLKVPKQTVEYAYGNMRIGTNTVFADWKANVVAWTKENGMGIFEKNIQAEYIATVGYLHYSHKKTNEAWMAAALTELCGVPVSARYRKISKSTDDDSRAVHVECERKHGEMVRAKLRMVFSKDGKGVSVTGFPLIFVPDRMYLHSTASKAGAAVVALRQAKLISKLETRMNWGVAGLDAINKKHGISLRVMLSRITHTGEDGVERQLFHSIDSSWNEEGVVFGWHLIFDEQAQTVMAGLYPYLRSIYGDTVEQYFSIETTSLQGKQTWDPAQGGVVGEDDMAMSGICGDEPWWEIGVETDTVPKYNISVDVSNITSGKVVPVPDDGSIPSINTRKTSVPNVSVAAMLNAPPPVQPQRSLDDATVSSGVTLDTRLDTVENDVGDIKASLIAILNKLNENNKKENKTKIDGKAVEDQVLDGPVT